MVRRETRLAEKTDGAGHVPGRSDEHPTLPRLGIGKLLGQGRVLGRVARRALDQQSISADAQIAQHHAGRVRLDRRLAQDFRGAAGEQDLGRDSGEPVRLPPSYVRPTR